MGGGRQREEGREKGKKRKKLSYGSHLCIASRGLEL